MSVQQMNILYHASFDPNNTTDMMDWTWTNLILDWTNAKWVLKGDLDIYARTASMKYDDCRVLHLPKLTFCINLKWNCFGDSNDHHSVMPCAPDKIPEFSLEKHDSFRAFRSQSLSLSMSFETKGNTEPGENIDVPKVLYYASTLRWLDKIKMCFDKVNRPIRRGPLFKNTFPRKPQFTRHLKQFAISMNLHQFEVNYWWSFAKQHGIEMKGQSLSLSIRNQCTLTPVEDGLIHRPESNWTIKQFKVELNEGQMWLCSQHGEEDQESVSMFRPVRKSYFMSVDKVMYTRDEPTQPDDITPDIESEHPSENPVHKVQIYELKGIWSKYNRNVAFGLYNSYKRANELKKNLSADALKGFKIDPSQARARSVSVTSPPTGVHRPSSPSTATPSPQTRIQQGHGYSMLRKLVSETDSNFVAYTEEEPSGAPVEQLSGMQACQTEDILQKNWLIELHNSQVMIKGCETHGHMIVGMGKAHILSCMHQPVWRERQLKSKNTWIGSVECMQYYATVDAGKEASDDIMWLPREYVEDRPSEEVEGIPEMVGSGQSVGGVISSFVGLSDKAAGALGVQMQRIISRCRCQFFYASFGEVDSTTLKEVPQPPSEDSDMWEQERGVDSFTLLHHDLNICTNPLQYTMILDIVNNLLLYVDPKKKANTDKLQQMTFRYHLSDAENHKLPITQKQEEIRELILSMRHLERQLFMVHKALEVDSGMDNGQLEEQRTELEKKLYDLKHKLAVENNDLGIMISCYKDAQLHLRSQTKAALSKQAIVIRRNEVCFKHAQWRLTQKDGQLGIADLVLRNFLYNKVNRSDDSGTHTLELGWIKMENLLPNTIYKDVVLPQEGHQGQGRQVTLRITCRERPPVGGIGIKEHFEVNVVPLTIQITHQLYKAMMAFFFKEKTPDSEYDSGQEAKGKKEKKKKEGKSSWFVQADDIDKMKDRAAKNNTFLYVKIPEVPIKVSYKGEKGKNIEDVHDFTLMLPTLEYHNQTWTWLDLLMALKNDNKRVLIAQAVKQKLHIRSRLGDQEAPLTDVQQEEDKAKMLLGARLLTNNEKPSSRKSLFGKSSK
ncbi:unnamed protein product [Owenia fusiformis]|uniref:FMP27 C-terminal domain-containing protein n=1 Tax=Owenia fusiformis TaxID=6347 RepID=A0A8S4Q3Y9_OWEFU|nr:unnamed protein product [Owenia fusiformis]